MSQPKQPTFYILYAEDVRQESDGKATIIGWYQGSHIVKPKDKPLVLPKLSMVCTLMLPVDKLPQRLTSKLRFAGVDIASHDITNILSDMTEHVRLEDADSDQDALEMVFVVTVNNHVFKTPGALTMIISVDDNHLQGNAIQVVES